MTQLKTQDIVLDIGSAYIKVGFAGSSSPVAILNTPEGLFDCPESELDDLLNQVFF